MSKYRSDKKKTSAELEADIRELRAQMEADVRDLQARIDEKQKLADAARAREEAQARLEREIEEARFNSRFVDTARNVMAADCVRDGRTVYDCIVGLMDGDAPRKPDRPDGDGGEDLFPDPDGGDADGSPWSFQPYVMYAARVPEPVQPDQEGDDDGCAAETPKPEDPGGKPIGLSWDEGVSGPLADLMAGLRDDE